MDENAYFRSFSSRELNKLDRLLNSGKLQIKMRKFLREKLEISDEIDLFSMETPEAPVLEAPSDGSTRFIIDILSTRFFLDLLNPTGEDKILIDISMAGRRFRTKYVLTEADPGLEQTYIFNSYNNIDYFLNTGHGEVSAIICNKNHETRVFGYGTFEWRRALAISCRFPIELKDCCNKRVGYVHLRVSVTPTLINEELLDTKLKQKHVLKSKIAKIYSRLLPTPVHALRFVSLIKTDTSRKEDNICYSLHSILSSNAATIPEKCILLTSFLLGYGFDAYMTHDKVYSLSESKIIQWDILNNTTEEIEYIDDDVIELTGLEYKLIRNQLNPNEWKRKKYCEASTAPAIRPCDHIDEFSIENEVKKLISQHRIKSTKFYVEIENAIRPLIFSLENSKINNVPEIWSGSVNHVIRSLTPSKRKIILHNLNINFIIPIDIFNKLKETFPRSILESDILILSISIFPYAENIYSVWLIYGYVS